jgi:outer membrane receptor for ferrienterochelin and colicins
VKGGVSHGYKTPRLEQMVDGIIGFTGQGRIASIGSPGLEPETRTTTELAAHYASESGFMAGVTVFTNAFREPAHRNSLPPDSCATVTPTDRQAIPPQLVPLVTLWRNTSFTASAAHVWRVCCPRNSTLE